MIRSSKLIALVMVWLVASNAEAKIWQSGELSYDDGQSEVSAFVNAAGNTQLQTVLCSKGAQDNYRFTLLLPQSTDISSVVKVTIKTDLGDFEEYAELSGNSLDLQIDDRLLVLIPKITRLSFAFDKEDASYLGIPDNIQISLVGADLTLKTVASQCTALCLSQDYKCNFPLLSSILWPNDKFKNSSIENIDDLCTSKVGTDLYKFKFSKACNLALDRFYNFEGVGPLSALNKVFLGKDSSFQKYADSWNDAVVKSPSSAIKDGIFADTKDWYLLLYSLVGSHKLREFPQSFYLVNNKDDDPTTMIYDIDARYDMELLKYSSVLFRRIKGNINAINSVEKALKMWQDFYREFCLNLPNNNQAQALRPLIYRQMLMRVWKLAGKPQSLKIGPENAFIQGVNGRTTTNEPLESLCSFFEGAGGDQFFFGSNECVQGIQNYMRTSPLRSDEYYQVVGKWDLFANAWVSSIFHTDSLDDAVGENNRANLSLTLLSLFRLYGFGDYFLMRECLSSRDLDICGFEANKIFKTYTKEFNYRLESIANVNENDAKALNDINNLWLDYYHELEIYVNTLVKRGLISAWRADFVKGVAIVVQTNAILNFPYDREQLPDISSDTLYPKDYDIDEHLKDEKMSIEQYKYDDDFVQEPNDDPDLDIDEDLIVPD